MSFPFANLGVPEHQAPLPKNADLVVIGGGVIGVCTALFAARSGLRVVLCEKGRVAAEQSGRNWGWIRQQGRDPSELPLMIEARGLWQALAAECGEDIGLAQTGVTYLAKSEREMTRYEAFLRLAREHGLDTRMIRRDEAARAFPDGNHVGGILTPTDMTAEPWLAVPALARLAVREGVAIREICAVRTLETEAGRVCGVITEAGRVDAPVVALCAGAWSRLFLARHGIALPQLSVRASVAATDPLSGGPSGALAEARLGFRPRSDGGYTIAPRESHELFIGPDAVRSFGAFIREYLKQPANSGLRPAAPPGYPDAWGTPRRWVADKPGPFERTRILNPRPNFARLDRARRDFAVVFPRMGPVRLKARWAGMIDVLPDTLPVIDETPRPGLWLATGTSGHGFGIGPAIGRVLADLVRGAPPGHDLSVFRFTRFATQRKRSTSTQNLAK